MGKALPFIGAGLGIGAPFLALPAALVGGQAMQIAAANKARKAQEAAARRAEEFQAKQAARQREAQQQVILDSREQQRKQRQREAEAAASLVGWQRGAANSPLESRKLGSIRTSPLGIIGQKQTTRTTLLGGG